MNYSGIQRWTILVYRDGLFWYTGMHYSGIQVCIILVYRNELFRYTGMNYSGIQGCIILVNRNELFWYTGMNYSGIQGWTGVLIHFSGSSPSPCILGGMDTRNSGTQDSGLRSESKGTIRTWNSGPLTNK